MGREGLKPVKNVNMRRERRTKMDKAICYVGNERD